VWGFVSDILKDPERLRCGLDKMLQQEKALAARNPDKDKEGWLKKLSDLDRQEERLHDLYLEGNIAMGRYEERLSQLKQARRVAEDELERIRDSCSRIEHLERDRDALLDHYSQVATEGLERLEPEERSRVYKMLDLTVLAHENGSFEVKWVLGGDLCRDNATPLPGSCYTRGR
jgi:DNA repair ATPase RecN